MSDSFQNQTAETSRISRLDSIQTRLLIVLIVLVLLPAGIMTMVSSTQGARNAEEQVISQLETVAALKEAEIKTWLGGLQNELLNTITTQQNNVLIEAALDGEADFLVNSQMRTNFRRNVALSLYFDEIFLLDRNGIVINSNIQSSIAQLGVDYGNDPVFLDCLENIESATVKINVPRSGEISVIVMRHIKNYQGEVIGAIAGHAPLETLDTIMAERAGLGDTGETYLVNSDYILLTESRFEGYPVGEFTVQTSGAQAGSQADQAGSLVYEGYRGVPVTGVYRWLPDLGITLLAEQDQSETLGPAYITLGINVGLTMASVLIAITIGLLFVRSIINPLENLTDTAAQIASGYLEKEIEMERKDEIGKLAQAFNAMSAQIRELVGGLEQQVDQRTHELELRTTYLEGSAEVSYAASSITDPDKLAWQVVDLIKERFGLYYVGLFLADAKNEWAVLKAGTGQAGEVMLANKHSLKIGEGMIGWAIANAESRIALDVGEDAVRFENPILPETRSEGALPLRSRGRVLGALTVQSSEPSAFTTEIITTLQTMVDQIAVAFDNAELLTKSEAALESERRAYGELSQISWQALTKSEDIPAYSVTAEGKLQIFAKEENSKEIRAIQEGQIIQKDGATVLLPIKSRGHILGGIRITKNPERGKWTKDQIQLAETLAEQLSVALESARLFDQTQRKAQREAIISDISAKIGASIRVDTILRTTVQELGQALGNPEVTFELIDPSDDNAMADFEE